jgi:hypothetical protein
MFVRAPQGAREVTHAPLSLPAVRNAVTGVPSCAARPAAAGCPSCSCSSGVGGRGCAPGNLLYVDAGEEPEADFMYRYVYRRCQGGDINHHFARMSRALLGERAGDCLELYTCTATSPSSTRRVRRAMWPWRAFSSGRGRGSVAHMGRHRNVRGGRGSLAVSRGHALARRKSTS